MTPTIRALALAVALVVQPAQAQTTTAPTVAATPPGYDETLARRLGADDMGMRSYVLAVLKTGPNRMPDGPERNAMFRGHFANIKRLSDEGQLVLAGPFDGVDGWRGLFVFAVKDIEEARRLTATDPVIASGEMVAEFHRYYGSAALMLVRETHDQVAKKRF
jgi:uncharacterized protein YciI